MTEIISGNKRVRLDLPQEIFMIHPRKTRPASHQMTLQSLVHYYEEKQDPMPVKLGDLDLKSQLENPMNRDRDRAEMWTQLIALKEEIGSDVFDEISLHDAERLIYLETEAEYYGRLVERYIHFNDSESPNAELKRLVQPFLSVMFAGIGQFFHMVPGRELNNTPTQVLLDGHWRKRNDAYQRFAVDHLILVKLKPPTKKTVETFGVILKQMEY